MGANELVLGLLSYSQAPSHQVSTLMARKKFGKLENKRFSREILEQNPVREKERVLRKITVFEALNRSFTTRPKTRRISWHKQTTVKTRATALKESFFPTADVPYQAVVQRMATLLGIVDRTSILSYLGRPPTTIKQEMNQTVRYQNTGTVVPKHHTFRRTLSAKRGYIETFELGYVYVSSDDEWNIHWNHEVQANFSSQSERCWKKKVKQDFSLSPYQRGEVCEKRVLESVATIEKKLRESASIGERNCESESILKAEERVILEARAPTVQLLDEKKEGKT